MSVKVKMLLSYDGTGFGGWQRQKSGRPTVQGSLEEALHQIFNEFVGICGSGRTDAGVHARGQVAHFVAPRKFEGNKLLYGLNSLTPKEVAVRGLWEVPQDFHAMASAEKKTYIYTFYHSSTPCPFRQRFSVWCPREFDLNLLNSYSQALVGCHDFQSFQNSGSIVKNTVRRIWGTHWERSSHGEITFCITGSGFLRQMVRNIVGTFLELHHRGAPPSDVVGILRACDRRKAGTTALPKGLCLDSVSYPEELDNYCRKL